jgi:hypothetical protein
MQVSKRGYRSPTIPVDGRDGAGPPPNVEHCCRIYETETGEVQAPEAEKIAVALTGAHQEPALGPVRG